MEDQEWVCRGEGIPPMHAYAQNVKKNSPKPAGSLAGARPALTAIFRSWASESRNISPSLLFRYFGKTWMMPGDKKENPEPPC